MRVLTMNRDKRRLHYGLLHGRVLDVEREHRTMYRLMGKATSAGLTCGFEPLVSPLNNLATSIGV